VTGPPLDATAPVRSGEELHTASLAAWLEREVPDLAGPITVEQFPAGHSNLTYLLRIGERQVVLRRPPFGTEVKTGHDMGREHRILSGLHPVWPQVPRPLAFCDDPSVLGAPFYLMERVPGVILRGPAPAGVDLDVATMERLTAAFVETFAGIHAVDLGAAGLDDLGRPEGYVQRQVDGWARRYAAARTGDVPALEQTITWLQEHRPPESGASLIHNDFKYDNLVLDPADLGTVRAVLDWEMATVGDPLMDLGTSLAYWVQADDPPVFLAIAGPTARPGSLTRAGLVEAYAAASGREVADPVFYYAYGLFKVAVIVQQIYYRYHQGHTRDQRFAGLDMMAALLGGIAQEAIARGTV
jgi:aminoglycoside phosphotransferase (APT) family kinase protein